MRNADGVKCLHCHYAHFLARPQHGNIIGQWTHEALLEYDAREKAAQEEESVSKEDQKQESTSASQDKESVDS